jgi:hypothetical protein
MVKEFCMKNMVKLLGIIALVAVIAFSLVACKKDALDGTTWKGNAKNSWGNMIEIIIKFNRPNFTLTMDDDTQKGSYDISELDVTLSFDKRKMSGKLAGNTLTLSDSWQTVTFTKQ